MLEKRIIRYKNLLSLEIKEIDVLNSKSILDLQLMDRQLWSVVDSEGFFTSALNELFYLDYNTIYQLFKLFQEYSEDTVEALISVFNVQLWKNIFSAFVQKFNTEFEAKTFCLFSSIEHPLILGASGTYYCFDESKIYFKSQRMKKIIVKSVNPPIKEIVEIDLLDSESILNLTRKDPLNLNCVLGYRGFINLSLIGEYLTYENLYYLSKLISAYSENVVEVLINIVEPQNWGTIFGAFVQKFNTEFEAKTFCLFSSIEHPLILGASGAYYCFDRSKISFKPHRFRTNIT